MSSKNLSEELFKPHYNYPETSSLVHRQHHADVEATLDGSSQHGCYRMLNKLIWTWRGVPPQESSEVLAGYWPGDPFGTEEDARLIANSSADGKLLSIAPRPALASFKRALNQVAGKAVATEAGKFTVVCFNTNGQNYGELA